MDLERKHQVIVEEMSLDDFMEVHQLDESSSEVTGVVTYFNLCDITRKMAKSLHALKDSYTFTTCWKRQAERLSLLRQDDDEAEPELMTDDEPYSLEDVYRDIFEPCHKEYENIYTSLRNETVAFRVVDSVFEVYKGRYEDLKKDLEVMCKINPRDNKRWIKGRIRQIQQYHDLHLAVESAKVIMDVKKILGLEGSFQILDRLLEFVSLRSEHTIY